MRVLAFDCVVLHDVDTIAGDERIPYRCPRARAAVHLAVAVEKYNFTLPFSRYFGGVLVVSREQFARINGASNVYFGWGGEGAHLPTPHPLPLPLSLSLLLIHSSSASLANWGQEQIEMRVISICS